MDEQTESTVVEQPYLPAAVTDFGTVTAATLGNKKHDPADQTEYWNAA